MSTTIPSTGSTPSTENSSSNSTRGKTDPAWGHCKDVSDPGSKKMKLQCLYCGKNFQGGGISRFKEHLAGVKGQVGICSKVHADVRYQMKQNIDGIAATRKRKKLENCSHFFDNDKEDEMNMNLEDNNASKVNATQSKGKQHGIASHFMPRTTPGAQPTIKSVLQSKEARERCDLAISKWMLDTCIPFNAANSFYYQAMVDAIASMGAGYKAPSFHSLRGYLLNKNVQEVKKFVNTYRTTWLETGCTIMADGWTDRCRRTLINFLVYCPRGIVFIKSVDASEASKTAEMLFKLFREIVLHVGKENVVHFVTDNAANYVAAGRLLEKEFPTLFWSPCAAHCINLMLQDFGKLDEVNVVVSHASKITKYIYNHCYALHLMRNHTGGKEILRPAPTRFATNFIALHSILSRKDALRAMVTSREWTSSAYAKQRDGKRFVDLVLDSTFWKECAIIVRICEPLVCVLRIVDSEDSPAMGKLYRFIHKAREDMVNRFQKQKKRIEPYLKILDDRWDRQLHKNLHAAGFWLNPAYQYDVELMSKHSHTISGLVDVIERYAYDNPVLRAKLTSETSLFRKAEGDFGKKSAKCDRQTMMPDEWWLMYGCSAPNLQKLAIRVLSQTCSASGCERNWSAFEHIHSKKRNRLEHQRLNDLVYVHYNLRLQQRNYLRKKSYDPIDLEDSEDIGSWILEDDPPTLTPEELEAFQREMEACTIQDKDDDCLVDESIEFEDEDDDEGGDEGIQIQNDFANASTSFGGGIEIGGDILYQDNPTNYTGEPSPWNWNT